VPALNFQKRFAPMVESGEKSQTIRATRKRPFKEGDTLYLYTGMRTKVCRKLGEVVCTGAVKFYLSDRCVQVNGQSLLTPAGRDEFAWADGFTDMEDMAQWFEETHGLPFYGQLIKWGK